MTVTSKRLAGSRLLTRQAAWKLAHPEAVEAHRAVQRAIRRGDLAKQPCVDCGDPHTEGHHPDYSKPLAVEWLCRKHHRARHRRPITKGPKS